MKQRLLTMMSFIMMTLTAMAEGEVSQVPLADPYILLEDGKYYTVLKVKNSFMSDDSLSFMSFDDVPAVLKEIYEKATTEECLDLKYPYYDGMDKKTYESFLLFLINKYETIKSYLPDDSDRLPVINKELQIMNDAYDRFKTLK